MHSCYSLAKTSMPTMSQHSSLQIHGSLQAVRQAARGLLASELVRAASSAVCV